MRNQRLILNGMFRASCPEDTVASALERRGTLSLQTKREFLARLPVSEVALRPHNLLGIAALRELALDGPLLPSRKADLERAQIKPFAWVINQSIARAKTADPLLGMRLCTWRLLRLRRHNPGGPL